MQGQCRCYAGASRLRGDVCVMGAPYILLGRGACGFGTYNRGVDERCASCRKPPFPACEVGMFVLEWFGVGLTGVFRWGSTRR